MRTKTLGFASSGVALALVVVNACTFGADDYVPVFNDGSAGLGGESSGGSASGGTKGSGGAKASGGTDSSGGTSGSGGKASGGSGAGGNSSGGTASGGAASGGGSSGGTANGECGTGTFDHDDNPSTACKDWTECEPGQHVGDPGTATSDRSCVSCESGKFSAEANAAECTDWTTDCDSSFQTDTPGTKTADVVCGGSIWQFGSDSSDLAAGVDTDSAGNVYVTGHTNGALPNQTATGAYARKYDKQGAVQWTTYIGDSGQGKGVAADADGNVYIVGDTYAPMPEIIDDPSSAYLGQSDGFISKIGPNGVAQWTRMFGSLSADYGKSIDVDGAGNIYVSGYTSGAIGNYTSAGSTDAFVIKYSPTGEILWSRQIGSSGYDLSWAVAADASGNVYLSGYTNGTIGPDTNSGSYDAFLWKYSSSGAILWQRQFGTSVDDRAWAVCADAAGYVYIAGYTTGTFPGLQAETAHDGFVRMFSASGNAVWTKQFAIGLGNIVSASCSSPGSVFLAGRTPGVLPDLTSSGSQDVFLVEYNSAGNEQWSDQFGTPESDDVGGVSVGPGRNVYVSGWTTAKLPGETLASTDGSSDAFLVRYQR